MKLLIFCVFAVLTTVITGKHFCQQNGQFYDCSHMELKAIPHDIPGSVRHLDLSSNRINCVRNNSFRYIYNLSSLRLDHNNINEIDRDSFFGLTNLEYLSLDANKLFSIPDSLFRSLVSLSDFSIQHNQIQGTMMKNLVKNIYKLDSLQTLNMDISPGFKFPCDFKRLTKLTELSLFGKDYSSSFTMNTFKCLHMTPLNKLYIHSVTSIEMETFVPLSNLTDLTIELGNANPNNPVKAIFKSLVAFKGRNMSNIRLCDSRLDNAFTLSRFHLKYIEDICLRQLSLHSMYITYVDDRAFQMFAIKSHCLEYFALTKNIIFDEKSTVLLFNIRYFKRLRVLRYNTYGDHVRYKRSNSISVSLESDTLVLTKSLEEIYIAHSMILPSVPNIKFINGLNLHVFSAPQNNVGNCMGHFTGIEKLRYLDISGWTCKQLSDAFLSGYPNLETFIAKKSFFGIGLMNNPKTADFFHNNTKLQIVDLSNNSISKIPSELFQQPFNILKQVNLSLNKITTLPQFPTNLKHMKVIDLSNNLLTRFTDKELQIITEIEPVTFYLRGNPLQCACTTLNFMKWIHETGNVADYLRVKCILEDGSIKRTSEVLNDLHTFEMQCKSKFWLIFSVVLTSVFLMSIVLTVIYLSYKFAIEYILLKWKMWWNGYKPLQTDYTYDAFVSYSHHDGNWAKQFHDKLNDMGFNLCLDAKDFIGGRGIAENVMTAIDSSRKVIFIITRNFLGSEWGSFELEMTRMHAFREHREEMVIVVLKDNVRLDEMPKVLKNMWFKVNCIQWPEDDDNDVPFHTKDIFFEKVKHALKKTTTRRVDEEVIYDRNVCV